MYKHLADLSYEPKNDSEDILIPLIATFPELKDSKEKLTSDKKCTNCNKMTVYIGPRFDEFIETNQCGYCGKMN